MSGKAKPRAKAKGGAKRKRKATTMVRVPRGKIGFPQSMRTTLRLVHTSIFEPSGTTALSEPIQVNGLFQPISTSSRRPRGFDQFMSIYGSYTVLGCKVHVRWMYEGYDGPSTTTGDDDEYVKTVSVAGQASDALACLPVACGVRKGTSLLGTVSAEDVIERERSRTVFITSQEGTRTVTQSAGTGEFYKNYTTVSSEGYSGNASGNPSIPVYVEPWCARAVNYDDCETKVVALIEMEFDTVFTNPLPLVASGVSNGM